MSIEALHEITHLPASDPGAPCPVIYASEHRMLVADLLAQPEDGVDCGVVEFERVKAHLFGSPNDEALSGHRLANLGLESYAIFEVTGSSWVAELCARNRVHPSHQDSAYDGLRHFVFTFHDSTLEVAARSFSTTTEAGWPIDCVSRRLADRREWS